MRRRVVLVTLAVAACVVAWLLLRRSPPEEAIRRQLDRAARALRVNDAESPLERHARVNAELVATIAKDVAVEIPELTGIGPRPGRAELIGAATQASSVYSELDVGFASVDVKVGEGGSTARVVATATLSGTRRSGDRQRDVRACTFVFGLIDGTFRMTSIVVSPPSQ